MTGPTTYNEATGGNIIDQMDRYRELAEHDLMARSIATLKARGEWTEDRARALNPDKYPPLTLAGHLEMLALGERIARYYRHPSQVDKAVQAGASWAQIAAATGTTEDAARAAYREWAAGQHKYAGMGDDEYAAAVKAAGGPQAVPGPGGEAEDTRRLNEIRGVLDRFNWEFGDRQLALEEIDRLADGGQP
jgi:hypothetical protein